MYRNLGVGPATSILGALAAAAIPVPWIIMRYGKALRKRSKFAPYHEEDESEKPSIEAQGGRTKEAKV